MNVKDFFDKYKHALVALYFPFYMLWFMALENRTDVTFTTIHCAADDWIPFCEWFIIPYLLWFFYVLCTLMFLFLQLEQLENFYRTVMVLIVGMTTCLIIYTLFPNAQNMRPTSFARNNIFTHIITVLYRTDTDTNVLPSIHVYNSLAIHAGICRCQIICRHKWIRPASLVVCVLICMSTVFLKQHSVLDVIAAFALFLLAEGLFSVYNRRKDAVAHSR